MKTLNLQKSKIVKLLEKSAGSPSHEIVRELESQLERVLSGLTSLHDKLIVSSGMSDEERRAEANQSLMKWIETVKTTPIQNLDIAEIREILAVGESYADVREVPEDYSNAISILRNKEIELAEGELFFYCF
jgi:hypothetical protein